MRLILSLLLLSTSLFAQNAKQTEQEISAALAGRWAGYLEYRDFSEPPTSTKRVQLPTWLDITPSGDGLSARYIYDDGPNKVVEDTEKIMLHVAQNTYESVEPGKPPRVFQVAGFSSLKSGLGTLVMNGTGTDNGKPADVRITLTIRRNLVEWLQEARPAGSTEPFVFRHLLRLTRAQPPSTSK